MPIGRSFGGITEKYLRKFGRRPPRLQAAALPWRMNESDEIEFMLTTSRRSGRWIIPKGNIDRGEATACSASREAWEETGLIGEISPEPLGVFDSRKYIGRGIARPLRVVVHTLQVSEIAEDYPEAGERERRWLDTSQAAKLVDERHLAALIRRASIVLPIGCAR